MLLKHEIKYFVEFTGVHETPGSKREVVGINKLSPSSSPLADLSHLHAYLGVIGQELARYYPSLDPSTGLILDGKGAPVHVKLTMQITSYTEYNHIFNKNAFH